MSTDFTCDGDCGSRIDLNFHVTGQQMVGVLRCLGWLIPLNDDEWVAAYDSNQDSSKAEGYCPDCQRMARKLAPLLKREGKNASA